MVIHDLFYNDITHGHNVDNRKRAFSDTRNSFIGNREDYKKAMDKNLALYESKQNNNIDGLSYSNTFNSKEMQVLNSSAQINKLYNIQENGGEIFGWDTETIGDLLNPENAKSYDTITEFGLARKTIGGASSTDSIVFGLNKKQGLEAFELIDNWVNSGFDVTQFTNTQLSTLERFSRNAVSTSQIKKKYIERIGEVATVDKLAESKVTDADALRLGVANLMGIGGTTGKELATVGSSTTSKYSKSVDIMNKHFERSGMQFQRIGDEYGNSILQKAINLVEDKIASDNSVLLGYNINYDVSVLNSIAKRYGLQTNIKTSDFVDLMNVINATGKFSLDGSNTTYDIAKEIASYYDGEVLSKKPGSLEEMARLNGIDIAAHNAGSDAMATIHLGLVDDFLNIPIPGKFGSGSFAEIALNTLDKMKAVTNVFYNPMENNGAYKPVLYANNALEFNKNGKDYAYTMKGKEKVAISQVQSHGVHRGNVYSINEIKEVDGGVMVDFLSYSDKNKSGMIKFYSSVEDAQKSLQNNFTMMFTGKKIPRANSPIRSLYISKKDIEYQRMTWEADTARREFSNFFESANTTIDSKGVQYGGWANARQYYSVFKDLKSQIGESELEKKKVRSAIMNGEKDDIIYSVMENHNITIGQDTFARNFKSMIGKLASEETIFDNVEEYLSDKKGLNNFSETLIAQNYRNEIVNSLENSTNLKVAESIAKSERPWVYASQMDFVNWNITANGNATSVSIQSAETLERDLLRKAESIASSMFPDKVKSKYKYGSHTNMRKEVETYRQLKDIITTNIINNGYVKLKDNDKMKLTKMFEEMDGNVTSVNNYFIANKVGMMFENAGLTANTSGLNLKTFKELHGTRNLQNISNDVQDFFLYKNKGEFTGSTIQEMRDGLHYINTKNDEVSTLGELADTLGSKDSLVEANQRLQNTTSLRSDFNEQGDFYEVFKERMGFTDENMRLLEKAIYHNASSEGASKGGIASYVDKQGKTDVFTSILLSEEQDKAFVIFSDVNKSQNIISILQDNLLSESQKIEAIRGTEDVPTSAKGVVWELNAINRRGDTSGDELGLITSDASVAQGDNGYERIIKNRISFFHKNVKNEDGSFTKEPTLKFQNDYDDILKVLQSKRGIILDAIKNGEEYKGTRALKRGVDNVLMDMSAYSGYQTLLVNGKYKRVPVPNIADLMQSEGIQGTEELKQLALEIAHNGKTEDAVSMRRLFSMFLMDRDITERKKVLEKDGFEDAFITKKKYDQVALEDFFRRHLFDGDFSDEQGRFHSEYSGTFMEFLKNNTSTGTKEVIDYLYDHKDIYSQIIKETEATKGIISMTNRMEADQFGNLAATQRPTNIQALSTMWFDKKEAENYFDAESLKRKDVVFGNIIENQKVLDIKAEYADSLEEAMKTPYKNLSQNMTGYVKQMSDLEIAKAYQRLENVNLAGDISRYSNVPIDVDRHQSLVEATDKLFRQTFTSTHESAEFVLPSFAAQEAFSSREIHTVRKRPLSDKSKEAFIRDMEKSNGKIANGYDMGSYKTKKVIYDGPTGTITNLDEWIENPEKGLKVLPDAIETGSIKLMHQSEKATGYTIRLDVNDDRFNPFIQRNSDGSVNLQETQKILNYYTDEYFYKLTGDNKSVIVANLALSKHTSADVVYGGFLNRLGLEYTRTGNQSGFNDLVKKFGLNDYLYYDNTGTIVNNVSNAPMNTINRIKDMVGYIQGNWDVAPELNSTLENYLDDVKNNRVLTAIARTKLQDTLGDAVTVDNRMANVLRMIGKGSLVSELNDSNSVFYNGRRRMFGDFLADDLTINRKLTPGEIGARKTVKGIATAIKYSFDPNALVGTTGAVTVDAGELFVPKSGSKISDMSESFYMVDGKASAFIEGKLDAAALDDVNIAVVDLSKMKPGFSYDLENAKGLTSFVIPLVDTSPVKDKLVYSKIQTAINSVLETINSSNDKAEISKAINDLYETYAYELSGATDSYMTQKVIRSMHRNAGQTQAQRSITNTINLFVKEPEMIGRAEEISKAIERAATIGMDELKIGDRQLTIDDISLYNPDKSDMRGYKGVYMREVNGKLKLDNVIEFSEQAMEETFGVKFNRIGMDVIKSDVSRLSVIKDLQVTEEMMNAYKDELVRHLEDIGSNLSITDELIKDGNIKRRFIVDILKTDLTDIVDKYVTNKPQEFKDDLLDGISKINLATKNDYVNNLVDEINHATLTTGMPTSEIALMKKKVAAVSAKVDMGYAEVGKRFLEEYGVYTISTRYPVFTEGHTSVAIARLNRSLKGISSVQVPWLQIIQKLDFDGDTKFDIFKIAKKGGLLLSESENDYTSNVFKSLAGAYDDITNKQYNFLGKKELAEMGNESEAANIFAKEFEHQTLLKWGINQEFKGEVMTEDKIKALIDLANKGDEAASGKLDKIFTQWVEEKGNMIKNKEVIMSSIKAKVTKGNIGYISNVNYALRDSLLTVYDDILKNKGDFTEINRIKKDLVDVSDGLLWFTEQNGIDTKHVFDALSTAETLKYQGAIKSLMTGAINDRTQRDALSSIYDSMASKLFKPSDLEKISGLKSLNYQNLETKLAIIERVMDRSTQDLTTHEQWLRSLIDFSKIKSARDSFNSIISTGKIYGNVAGFKNALFSGKHADDTLAGQIVLHTKPGELETLQYFDGSDSRNFTRAEYYFTTSDEGRILAHSVGKKGITHKNGRYQMTFDTYDLGMQRGSAFEKVRTNDPLIISGSSVEEINAKLTKEFGRYGGHQKSVVNRNKEYRLNLKDRISKQVATEIINNKTKSISSYDRVKTIHDLNSVEIGVQKLVAEYMGNVKKEDIRVFGRRINYMAKNKISTIAGQTVTDTTKMHSILLDEINQAIINDGSNAKKIANDNGFTKVFDYYFNKIVAPIDTVPENLGPDYNWKPSELSFKDIVDDYQKNSYNIEDEVTKIKNLINDKTSGTPLDNALTKNSFLNKEVTKLKAVNDLAEDAALQKIKNAINPLEVRKSVTKFLSSDTFGDMNVAYGKYFGRNIRSLGKSALNEILNTEPTKDPILNEIINQTKAAARAAVDAAPNDASKAISGGLSYSDKESAELLRRLNDQIVESGQQTKSKMKDAKGESAKTAEKIISKKLNVASDIKSALKGKGHIVGGALAGLAALGMLSNMSKDKSSPLTPDQAPVSQTTVNQNQIKGAKRSFSRKTVYDAGNNEAGLSMSAKGARNLNSKQMGQMIARNTNMPVDVHTYDDRSQVSNNWLERKFSEMV